MKWLQSFFLIIRERYDIYDYQDLLTVLIQIFEKNQIPFYISQIPHFAAKIQEGGDLYEAHKYFVELKQTLKQEITEYQIGVSCEIAESYLAKLMEHLSFITNYKLIFIKMIENNKVLNDKNDVILIRNEDKFGDNLNLGPLLIDGNSLSGKRNTRFYFYMCATKHEFYYHYTENKDDVLIVSQQNFPEMYHQMSLFLETLFPNS